MAKRRRRGAGVVARGDSVAVQRTKWRAYYREIAAERGGRLLSREYVNAHAKLRWRCGDGHEWKAEPNSIRHGQWCPECARWNRGDGKRARAFAKLKRIVSGLGGECLGEYVNSQTHMSFRCAEGHSWRAVPGSIMAGTWCPYCAGCRKLSIIDMQEAAEERGGECLSKEYVDHKAPLLWRCSEGHEWRTAANNIRQGAWCPYCAGVARKTLQDMHEMADEHEGRCLSRKYVNAATKLRWRCRLGHDFEATPNSVQQGGWCPTCARGPRLTIADMRAVAEERGGRCLSRAYVDVSTYLRWRCGEGHEWEANWTSVRHGHWCPTCAGHTAYTIDDMQEFAAEWNGECLSARYVNIYEPLRWRCQLGHVFWATPAIVVHGSWCRRCRKAPKNDLDRLRRIAKRRGGDCLSRHYVDNNTKVRWRCREGHEWEAVSASVIQGRWCPECAIERRSGPRRRRSIADMHAIAESRGGRCLSRTYVTLKTKLHWQCASGHRWRAQPGTVLENSWCPECAHTYAGTIDGMRALAADRGGRCLSRTYTGHRTVLRFECVHGHVFERKGMSVKSGAWCPECGNEWPGKA